MALKNNSSQVHQEKCVFFFLLALGKLSLNSALCCGFLKEDVKLMAVHVTTTRPRSNRATAKTEGGLGLGKGGMGGGGGGGGQRGISTTVTAV